MINTVKTILLTLVLFSIAGCAQLSKHADTIKPTAKLTGMRLSNINFDQVDLIFDLAVENKNPVAIDLAGMEYDFQIAEHSLVSGVTKQAVKIAANSTSPVALPVTLKFADLKKLPGKLWQQDTFAYQLDTKFNLKLPIIGNYAIPVSKQGELPVPKLPKLSLKDLTIKNVSFTSAELVAHVEVNNPNNFNVAMSQFNYQLNINEQQWSQGNIAGTNTIPKKAKGLIEIPVTLDLLSVGTAAYKLIINKAPINYQLTGNTNLDTDLNLLKNVNLPLDVSGTTALQ